MSPRSILFDHFWLKLFSLVLAALIWLAVWANLHNSPRFPAHSAPADGSHPANEAAKTFLNRPILVLLCITHIFAFNC